MAFADKMRSRGPVKEKDAFTADEVQRLMAQLPEDRIGWSIRLLLGTGMRTQELLALEPKHIAEDGSVIQIRQAINMVKGTPVVGTPKSRDSYRDVPIRPACAGVRCSCGSRAVPTSGSSPGNRATPATSAISGTSSGRHWRRSPTCGC